MEIIPGIDISNGLNIIVGILIKLLMVILSILALILVRQDQLMEKVVNIPVGINFKWLVWGYFVLTLSLAAIVIVLL